MADRFYIACDGDTRVLPLAALARDLGREVTVVASTGAAALVEAHEQGFATVAIKGQAQRHYIANLRAWDLAARRGTLWCDGLMPGLATAGRRDRIVALCEPPTARVQAGLRIARVGADAVVVPSGYAAAKLPGSRVLPDWVDRPSAVREPPGRVPATVGFQGRLGLSSGIVVLAEAARQLNGRNPDRVRLLVAGGSDGVPVKERAQVAEALTGVAGVQHLGGLSDAEFLSRIDLAVFPAVTPEASGRAVAQAMASRVPFVVSDAGALPEVAGTAHRWVARAGDASALAEVIGAALTDWDRTPLDQAEQRWRELYSPEAGRERLRQLLDELGR